MLTLVAPTYEQLAEAFPTVSGNLPWVRKLPFAETQDKVIIAKTDADGVGRSLGSRFGVTGFPSMSLRHHLS
jgi:protein disulfide-isomerase A6